MHETCDRCGPAVQARYRADRLGEIYLCRSCAMRFWPALAAQGWGLWLASEPTLAAHTRTELNAELNAEPQPQPTCNTT